MMSKNILFYLTGLFLLISCTGNNRTEVREYSLYYNNHDEFYKLIVYDNNDTLYLSKSEYNIFSSRKIKSNYNTIYNIKVIINKNLNNRSLYLNRSREYTNPGFLYLKSSRFDKSIQVNFEHVSKKLDINEEFRDMIYSLKQDKNIKVFLPTTESE